MTSIAYDGIFENNKKWVAQKREGDTDFSAMSVIDYAVKQLEVKHIFPGTWVDF